MIVRALLAAGVLAGAALGQDVVFPDDTARVEVPLDVVDMGDLGIESYVEIDIGGTKAMFLFDTGATFVIDKDFADKLGAEKRTKIFLAGVADVGKPNTYRVPLLRLGPVRFEQFNLVGMDLDTEETGVHGVIGTEACAVAAIEVDIASGRLVLHEDSEFEPPDGAVRLPLELVLQNAMFRARFDATRRERCLFDTGNTGALLLHRPYVRKQGLLADPKPFPKIRMAGVFREFDVRVGRLRELALGELVMTDVPVEMPTRDHDRGGLAGGMMSGNVGLSVFAHMRFTIDGRRRCLWLEPPGNVRRLAYRDTFGLGIDRLDARRVAVIDLVAGSPAQRAGLRVGDVILAIDDVEAGNDPTPIARALRARDRARVRISRVRERTFDLHRAVYLPAIELAKREKQP